MFFWNSYGLQDALSPVIEEFVFFHDYLLVVLVYVTVFVLGILGLAIYLPWMNTNLVHGQVIEGAWTTAPALILIIIGVPSLLLLYRLDETRRAVLRIKVVGHQWFWRYEIRDFWRRTTNVRFDSYILPLDERVNGALRLLDTDNRPALPYLAQIRVLVRRSDVLHSWAVPSLGVKIDAVPGRLNQTKLISYRPGLAYGQCSEICGANHSFMPIVLEFVRVKDYLQWVVRFEYAKCLNKGIFW